VSGLTLWIEVDVTCRLHDGRCAWDHGARRSLRRDRPQASRSRHRRAGRPVLSPLIPGCSVAGDQDPSRLLIRSPMPGLTGSSRNTRAEVSSSLR
jgi:hypothetical protein